MGLIELLVLLVVAAICGGIGQSLAGYTTGGCLTSIVVGFIGSYLGVLIARNLGLPELFALQLAGSHFQSSGRLLEPPFLPLCWRC